MQFSFCAQTDPGQARENNEDSVEFDASAQLAVLADGMGGYNAGEIASGMATAFIRTELSSWLQAAGEQATLLDLRRALTICVDNANRAVFNSASFNHHFAGMGTTLVVTLFREDLLLVGHIGDSRCYRLRAGELTQLTRDHSLLQEQIDAGLLTPAQAALSPHRNLVTRALGVEPAAVLEVRDYSVAPGDVYLLCSDGLSDMLDDAAIAKILHNQQPLTNLADELVRAANEQGGRDNISVVLVQAQSGGDRRGFISRLLGKP